MQENFKDKNEQNEKKSPISQAVNFVFEIIKVLGISLAIVLPIRTYIVQPFFVSGESMEPNFTNYEYILIDELSYRFREPQRGEVIVFKYPLNKKDYYIKRIIGLPGETIKFDNGKIVIVKPNGETLTLDESSYLPNPAPVSFPEITLAENEFYVRGDNRIRSFDSKDWGPIKREDIIGRVWLRIWPINKVQAFQAPNYK